MGAPHRCWWMLSRSRRTRRRRHHPTGLATTVKERVHVVLGSHRGRYRVVECQDSAGELVDGGDSAAGGIAGNVALRCEIEQSCWQLHHRGYPQRQVLTMFAQAAGVSVNELAKGNRLLTECERRLLQHVVASTQVGGVCVWGTGKESDPTQKN